MLSSLLIISTADGIAEKFLIFKIKFIILNLLIN